MKGAASTRRLPSTELCRAVRCLAANAGRVEHERAEGLDELELQLTWTRGAAASEDDGED
jgi:hypothetical protein